MNDNRRSRIDAIDARLSEIISELEGFAAEVEELMDEEQESLDNLPDSLRYRAEAAVDNLSRAGAEIASAIGSVEESSAYLMEACA